MLNLNSKADFRALIKEISKLKPASIRYDWSDFYNSPELLYVLNMPQTANAASVHGTYESGVAETVKTDKPYYTAILQDHFEDENSRQFTDTNSYNGSRAMFLHSDHAYSPAREIDAAQASKGIYGSLYARCSQRCVPLAVCIIRHASGKEESLYFPLNKYLIADDTWQRVPFWFDTPPLLQAGDTVRVFLMNDTKATLFIDDLACARPQ